MDPKKKAYLTCSSNRRYTSKNIKCKVRLFPLQLRSLYCDIKRKNVGYKYMSANYLCNYVSNDYLDTAV